MNCAESLKQQIQEKISSASQKKWICPTFGETNSLIALTALKTFAPESELSALYLPGPSTPAGAVSRLEDFCDHLNIKITHAPIKFFFSAWKNACKELRGELKPLEELELEQSLRGCYANFLVNPTDSLLLQSWDKTQWSLGLINPVAGGAGDYCLFGDLYQSEVMALGLELDDEKLKKHLLEQDNHWQAVLDHFQITSDEWKYVDEVLPLAQEEKMEQKQLIENGIPAQITRKIFHILDNLSFKRLEFCPILPLKAGK